jgi:hypothetical protein
MGQSSDLGRNASLDEQKERAAGRRGRTGQHEKGHEQIVLVSSSVPSFLPPDSSANNSDVGPAEAF